MASEHDPITAPLLVETLKGLREDVREVGKKVDNHALATEVRLDAQDRRLDNLEAWKAQSERRQGMIMWLVGLISSACGGLITRFWPTMPHAR